MIFSTKLGQKILKFIVVVVELPSYVRLCVTPWIAVCGASMSLTMSWNLLKFMSIELMLPSNHSILCCPLLPSILPSFRIFSSELALHIRWPKCWSFNFSISPSSEYSGLISFRIDWFDLLAVQGTLKSLLQHHSSEAWMLWCSAFFMVQPSHPYMTIRKTMVLTIWTFVGKVMSLLFNTLSRFVVAFLPRSSFLLLSWLQSPSTVILEPKKRKSVTASSFAPSVYQEVMGLDAMILVFLILSFRPAFSLSSITCIKRLFSSSLLSAIKVVSSTYLRWLIFLLAVLILACNLSSLTFHMMCSAYKLNKQGDSKQPCCTSFSILNQSLVQYKIPAVASWPTYRFLRRKVRYSDIPFSLRIFHCLLWSTQSEALA